MPSSIDPLVPVLRDNFWLTIHVLTITLSYAAFALAMGFGHILLFRYARNPVAARADAADAFLALSRAAAGRLAARGRHDSRRRVGELFLGPILGLGSEGNLGADRAALLHPDLARPTRRLVDAIWFGRGERGLFSRGPDGVVWREFCSRQRIAQLRLRHRRRNLCRDLCHPRFVVRRVCDLAISNEQTQDRRVLYRDSETVAA